MTRTERSANFAGAAVCVAALVYAIVWLQGVRGLEPCPLCVLDRVAFAVAAAVFLLAALHGPGATGRRLYALAALVPLAFGVAIAARHVWLQHLPADQVPACGPSFEYLVENFPLAQAFGMIFRGSGSCAEIQWRFLALSIPEWTLALFVALALLAAWLLLKRAPR